MCNCLSAKFRDKRQLHILFPVSQSTYIGIHFQLLLVWVLYGNLKTCGWIIYTCIFQMGICANTINAFKKKNYTTIKTQTFKCDLHANVNPLLYWLVYHETWKAKWSTVFTDIVPSKLVARLRKLIHVFFKSDTYIGDFKWWNTGINNCNLSKAEKW
jgi:hypothetical protein